MSTTGIGLATNGYFEKPTIAASASYPTIEIVTSTPLTRSSPIVFKIHDSVGLREVFVYVNFAGGPWEVVHDGVTGFSPTFTGPTNQRVSISDGYEYTILRDGGWPSTPVLRILPVNVQGNVPV